MKLLKLSDKIKIQIHDVTVELSPLSYAQKGEIQGYMLEAAKGDIKAGMEGAKLAIKYSVKSMKGITDVDGNEYELKLENNMVSDEDLEALMNSEMTNELTISCVSLLSSIPTKIINPQTGEELEGVKVIQNKPGKKKANK